MNFCLNKGGSVIKSLDFIKKGIPHFIRNDRISMYLEGEWRRALSATTPPDYSINVVITNEVRNLTPMNYMEYLPDLSLNLLYLRCNGNANNPRGKNNSSE